MSTSVSVHYCKSITSDTVSHNNNNAITLTVFREDEGQFDISLFGLPTHVADGLEAALRNGFPPRMTEDEIRADERRKIADRFILGGRQ